MNSPDTRSSVRRLFDGMAVKNVSPGIAWCVDIADMEERRQRRGKGSSLRRAAIPERTEEKGWAGRRLLQPNYTFTPRVRCSS
ncbi:hypothetical protein ABZP36_019009 [Zizania latifolia]